MTTLLHIDASARRTGSVTRDLTARIVARLDPATILRRDLASPLPLLTEDWVGANFTPADQRSDSQRATLAQSDALVAELQAADVIVIGLPVYNFGVPASLKAWIDLIARAGVTFKYTETGPQGLLTGKRAIVALASGGVPMGSAMDHASTFLRQVLGFVGITDVQFIAADAMATNPEATLKAALEQVDALAA